MIPRITGERNVDHDEELRRIGFVPAPVDMVNHPPHYRAGDTYETIKVIEAWELNYNLGCCIKYISRCGKKNDHIQDLEKARWYLTREIETLKKTKVADDNDDSSSEEE